MRAAVLHENNKIETKVLEKRPLEKGQVRVKVMAAGICGSDIHKMKTRWKYPLPAVLGHEFAGVVCEVGEGVINVKEGDRVVGIPLDPCRDCEHCHSGDFSLCDNYLMTGSHFHGAFAETVVMKSSNVFPIGNMDFEDAAMIEPLAVSMHGVIGIEPKLGDIVVVFGVGTIGILTIQCLLASGVKHIIAVDINDEKLAEAEKFGAEYIINPLNEDLKEKVFEYTNGLGADISFECAGSKITQEQCLLVTRKKGKVAYQGIAYQDVLLREEAFENIFRRELTLKGFWNSYSAPFPGREWVNSIDYVNKGQIKLKELVSHRYSLDETADAFDMILSRKESYNKVLILPQT